MKLFRTLGVHGDYSLQENDWWLVAFVHHPFYWRNENGFSVCEQLRWLCLFFSDVSACVWVISKLPACPFPRPLEMTQFHWICSHLLQWSISHLDTVIFESILCIFKILDAAFFLFLVLYPIIFWRFYSQARFKTHREDPMNADRWLPVLTGGRPPRSTPAVISLPSPLLPCTFPMKIIFLLVKSSPSSKPDTRTSVFSRMHWICSWNQPPFGEPKTTGNSEFVLYS